MESENKEVKLYNMIEVAKVAGCSKETVRRHINRGKLKAVRIGRRYVITHQNLMEWLNG